MLHWVPLEYSTDMLPRSHKNLTMDEGVPFNGCQLVHVTLTQPSEGRIFFHFAPSNP